MLRKLYFHKLACGHERTAFSRRVGGGYYCIECDKIVDSVQCSAELKVDFNSDGLREMF